jgi:hypothetical protein
MLRDHHPVEGLFVDEAELDPGLLKVRPVVWACLAFEAAMS